MVTERQILEQVGFVRSLARALVADPFLADDLAQEACLKALESPPREGKALRSWLARVVRNLAFRDFRARARRARREERAARPLAAGRDPLGLEEKKETLRRISRAVLELPAPYQEAVLLRFYQGLSPKEAARRLGIPAETFKTRVKRALEKLRSRLDRESPGGRKTWLAALLPFARGGRTFPAAGATAPGVLKGGIAVLLSKKVLLLSLPAFLLLGLGILAWKGGEPDRPLPPGEGPRLASSTPLPSPGPPPQRKDLSPFRVRGKVVGPGGRPLEGIEILASWKGKKESGKVLARTGKKGRYTLLFPQKGSALVTPRSRKWGPLNLREGRRKVRIPAEGVDFRLHPRKSARLVVRARNRRTGAFLSTFPCTLVLRWEAPAAGGTPGTVDSPLKTEKPKNGVLEKEILLPPGVTAARVQVRTPWTRRWADLEAGKTTRVVLEVELREIEGTVTDEMGRPLEGAWVYTGSPMSLRGNEPFKPLDPRRLERIPGAVKTGPKGRFRLEVTSPLVTAWKPGYSPASLPVEKAARIALPSLGNLEGILLDDQGRPRPGVVLLLDRTRETRTGKDGRFCWEGVEAGLRGICFPGRDPGSGRRGRPERYWGVRVKPGGTTKVTLGPGIAEVEVRLYTHEGKPFLAPAAGILVGLDQVFTFPPPFRAREGRFTLRRVLPGKYYLLTKEGRGVVEIRGPKARAGLGPADLTVFAKPGTTLALYPESAHPLLRIMCLRAARLLRTRAGGDGKVFFPGLPLGTYVVSTTREKRRKVVQVRGPGTTADCTSW